LQIDGAELISLSSYVLLGTVAHKSDGEVPLTEIKGVMPHEKLIQSITPTLREPKSKKLFDV